MFALTSKGKAGSRSPRGFDLKKFDLHEPKNVALEIVWKIKANMSTVNDQVTAKKLTWDVAIRESKAT